MLLPACSVRSCGAVEDSKEQASHFTYPPFAQQLVALVLLPPWIEIMMGKFFEMHHTPTRYY